MKALFPDAVVPPPDCYDQVAEHMLNVQECNPVVFKWPADDLAADMIQNAFWDGNEPSQEDVERSIRIWRERHCDG